MNDPAESQRDENTRLRADLAKIGIEVTRLFLAIVAADEQRSRLRADLAKITDAVAEGGWCSGETSSDPEHRGPTADDAVAVIREFYAFRERIWNEHEARDMHERTVYVLHSGYSAAPATGNVPARVAGAWRGWNKCKGSTDATLVFEDANAAEHHRRALGADAYFWDVWPIRLIEPELASAHPPDEVSDDGAVGASPEDNPHWRP